MGKLTIWDKQTALTFPDGSEHTADEVRTLYPVTKFGSTVLEWLAPGIVGAIDNIEVLREIHKIPEDLSDEETLVQIKAKREEPQTPIPETQPMTKADAQMLGQILTNIELNTMA